MRKYRTDWLLWAILALCLFAVAAFINPAPYFYAYSLFAYFRSVVNGDIGNSPRTTAVYALSIAVPALVVGWLIQVVVVRCGLRLGGHADPALTADYDDRLGDGAEGRR